MSNEQLIRYLHQELCSISGIGVKTNEALIRLNCSKVIDLLFHFPTKIITKKILPPICYKPQPDERVVSRVRVVNIPTFKYTSKVVKI